MHDELYGCGLVQNRDKPTTNLTGHVNSFIYPVPLCFLVRLSSPPVLHPCFTAASPVWRSVRCSLFPEVNSLNFTCHRLRPRNAALLSGRFHLADAYLKYPRYTLRLYTLGRRRPASWRREMGIVGRSSRNCSDDSYSFENGFTTFREVTVVKLLSRSTTSLLVT